METLHVNDNGHAHAESPYHQSMMHAVNKPGRGLINTLSFQHDIPYTVLDGRRRPHRCTEGGREFCSAGGIPIRLQYFKSCTNL